MRTSGIFGASKKLLDVRLSLERTVASGLDPQGVDAW
jgi:hypothetical protein